MENRKIYFAGFLIRVKIKDAVPYFIYAQTLTAQYQKWVLATSARSGQPGINAEEYKTFPIYLPNSEQEQQKIATCLSSLDEVITAEIQKLDLLKHHKKGLLQNLFPQEGETVPKYRFKEYENSGEWVEKTLGSIGKFTGGGTPSKANDSFWQGTIPWISSSDIMEDSIHQIKITRFISEGGLKDSATKIVPANSILIVSRVGVGKLAISNEVICTSQDFTNFTPYNDNLTLLAYYLKTQTILLLGFSQGMAIKGFTKEDISKLNLFLPKIEEQQKIADTLSSIDEFITAQSQTIEALKLHKKGLLQGLFPKIEA
jgi:type I restriction enzyme S subunit